MALSDLSGDHRGAVLDLLTAMGDDEYLHGDRLSSWLTVAPTLEEDNVLTSVAQDEMGHARLWFELVSEHRPADVDDLAIFRPAPQRRNSTLVEREFDGFADTVIRSFCYDRHEQLLLEAIEDGRHAELSGRAGVALDEEPFHREHVDEWLAVFASLSREADRERVRRAVESNLRHAGDLFALPGGEALVDSGTLARSPGDLESAWRERVLPRLAGIAGEATEGDLAALLEEGPNGRAGEHTDDLPALIEQIQPAEIERLDV